MRIIGLTGGIACGKSHASAYLRECGYPVFDSDAEVHALYQPGQPGSLAIARAFGAEMLLPDGSVDRAALGALVFGDAGQRARLEEIIHPLVRERMRDWVDRCRKCGAKLAFLDVPLLIEGGWQGDADEVWILAVPPKEQARRVIKRGFSEAEAWKRIDSQYPLERKLNAVFPTPAHIIDTSGAYSVTQQRIDELVMNALR